MPEAQIPEDFGGSFEEIKAGQYLFLCTGSLMNPPSKDGKKVFDGFKCSLQVRSGCVTGAQPTDPCPEIGKTHESYFTFPSQLHVDKGAFCERRIANLLIAVGICTEADREAKKSVPYHPCGEITTADGKDVDDFKGKLLVAYIKTVPNEGISKKTGQKTVYQNAEIDGEHVYHPLDERVAHVPKDPVAMKYVAAPAVAAAPAAKSAATQATANGNGQAKSQTTAQPQGEFVGAAAAEGSELDLSDL